MPTKNESLWLASGQAGENQARALTLPVEFTRVVVGDANGEYPPMDSSITALVNERLEGSIISHEVDPNDSNQRIVHMAVPPSLDFDAVELLLFAKYGETEFAHTYFRLAASYPIRTTENGGAQVKLKYTIRVNQNTDVNVFVSPNLQYATVEEVARINISYQNPATFTAVREAKVTEINCTAVAAKTFTLDESSFQVGDKVVINRLAALAGLITIITDAGIIIDPKNVDIGNTITMAEKAFTVVLIKTDALKWHMQVINAGGA